MYQYCTIFLQDCCLDSNLLKPSTWLKFTIGQATLVTSDGCGAIVFVPLLLFTCLTCGTYAKCIKVWKTNISKYMSRVRALIHISSSNHGRLKNIYIYIYISLFFLAFCLDHGGISTDRKEGIKKGRPAANEVWPDSNLHPNTNSLEWSFCVACHPREPLHYMATFQHGQFLAKG